MHFSITGFIVYIIERFGYLGIGAIIFAESGLLLGFILPGDSLIFLAGLFASQGLFNLWVLFIVIIAAAVLGDNCGYLIGRRLGRKVFEKNSFIFNQDNLHKTEAFFVKYGKLTFIIQRFMPIIRAFAPLLGGVGDMRYRTFFLYDLAGCIVWGTGVTILGYFLGAVIPNIDTYILPLTFLIVIISLIPSFVTYWKHRKPKTAA